MSITKDRSILFVKTAFKCILENNGEMEVDEMIKCVSKKVKLTEEETEKYSSSKMEKWETNMRFMSINADKAGWLIKKRGIWYVTSEGEKALQLSDEEFYRQGIAAYRKWNENRNLLTGTRTDIEDSNTNNHEVVERTFSLETSIENAKESIRNYILNLNPYEFQDLVAALLRGMGYFTPFVAPRGKDGGIDILAYRDPIGALAPRIKVQVKHRENKTNNAEIQRMKGLLNKDGESGLFISTGGFTPDAITVVRTSDKHIETIDLDEFIDLWEKNYDKLSDEDKRLLPLTKVYFLTTSE